MADPQPPAVPPATAAPDLRTLVKSVADGLRRDADGIEADPHLNKLVRRADAEARRAAAERIDMALTEDRATPGRPLREAFEAELRTLRRLAGAAAPSRAARVRSAVEEFARLILAAMDSDGSPAPGQAQPATAGQAARSFEDMLADPHEQFDRRSELLASIAEYAAAPPASAGIAKAERPAPHATAAGPVEALAAELEAEQAQALREAPADRDSSWYRAQGRASGLRRGADLARERLAPEWDRLQGARELSADLSAALEAEWATAKRLAARRDLYHGERDEAIRDRDEARAQLARDPEVWRGPCETHAGQDHVQTRTNGHWLCVIGLRGLDEGWREMEAELAALRIEHDGCRDKVTGDEVSLALLEENEGLARDLVRLRDQRDKDREALAEWARANEALGKENERLAEGGRQLGHTLSLYVRSLYATWIDAVRGDFKAVTEALAEATDWFDGPKWDGKETGGEWFERTGGMEGGEGPSGTRPPRPPVVCLCGSTRFYEEFRRQNLRLTLAGEIVLSIGCDTKSDADLAASEALGDDPATVKARLDDLHKRKIDLADYVLVLNVGGYVGESTRSEIAYATAHGKPVRYLEATDDRS